MKPTARKTKIIAGALIFAVWILAFEAFAFGALHFVQYRYNTLVYDSTLIEVSDVKRRPGYDRQLGWVPKQDTDSHGARIDTSGQPYSSACIEMYGDSFTWSDEVSRDAAWPNLLSSMIGCRVLNFGVGGYGSDQATMRFMNNKPHAKIAVLNHLSENTIRNVNQFRNLIYPSRQAALKPRFALENGKLTYVPAPKLDVHNVKSVKQGLTHDYFVPDGQSGIRSAFSFPYTHTLYRIAAHHFQVRAKLNGQPRHAEFYRPDHAAQGLQLTAKIIQAFVEEARSRDQVPVVTVIPMCKDLKAAKSKGALPYGNLLEILQESGIQVFDFASAFSELEDFESYFIHCTGHPNKRGYKLMAKSFSEFLSQSALPHRMAHWQ